MDNHINTSEMKKLFVSLFTAILLLGGCKSSSTSPLENWKAGSANDDVFLDITNNDIQEMVANELSYLEIDWWHASHESQKEMGKWTTGVKEQAEKAGIKIWAVHLPFGGAYDISQTNDSLRAKAIDLNLKAMQQSAGIVAPEKFIIHPSSEPIAEKERKDRIEASRKSLHILAAESKKLGIPLMVENLPRTCLGNTSTELLSIIDSIDNTAICFDVNHLLIEEHADFIQNAKNKIQTTHMSDYDQMDEKHWLPGDGVINWKELINQLIEVGYKGPFIFEVGKKGKGGKTETISNLGNSWKKLKLECTSK